MAGGHVKYRHLSRDSSARKALLRGLVTQLIQYEHIQTTHAKAKEAQRLAENLITLAKRNTETARRSAQGILYTPHLYLPKLFGELRQRYMDRAGGYTRVVRTEPRDAYDQAETSILELVDGRRDSRFMLMAKAVARSRLAGFDPSPLTMRNVEKVTKHRDAKEFEDMVSRFTTLHEAEAMDKLIDEAEKDKRETKEEEQKPAAYQEEAKKLAQTEEERSRQLTAMMKKARVDGRTK
ncbi:hypothetical protein CDD82_1491 [Ophiocordyceps australis]|uniref:Ribosomal protein L17 n=1 Tax=Ophiocordyceps australis TaxID=1399860 RepID=A0A2C5ZLX7_9HYPO|nr:hypothetical protein CDD82_1491 [Ophiocordyceps australis]